MSFTKGKLQNEHHPYISYTIFGGEFGVVYTVGKN